MKKYLYLAVIALACSGALVSSCNDDKLTGDSIFTTISVPLKLGRVKY